MNWRLTLKFTVAAAAWLSLLATTIRAQDSTKWSRQVDGIDSSESDTLDWVPLAQPLDGSNNKDRSGNGRVLTYSQTFPPNARFGDLPKSPSSAQFEYPYQFQRFANAPQAQPLRQTATSLKSSASALQSQEPTSQSFFKFEMPFRNEALRGGSASANVPPTLQTGYQIQHSFGGAGGAQSSVFNSPLYNAQPVFPQEYHPKTQNSYSQALSAPSKNFIEDILPLKSSTYKEPKSQQTLQSVTPQVFPVDPQPESIFELNKPSTFQSAYQQPATAPAPASAPASSPSAPAATSGQQQDVQLLYVPYNTLYNQQQQQQQQQQSQGLGASSISGNNNYDVNKYNVNAGLPAVNPYQINQFYTQDPLGDFFSTSTTSRPLTTTPKAQELFQSFGNQLLTTVKPKPKAHQPPLAMFLLRSSARPMQADVVAALRNSHTISVIDAPTKQTPDIFVGPAGMPIPNGYVKFDLPYLSQLAHTHDLRDVPFFVAPLSYRTPNGFNKILLPEPHVGSIVVNRAKDPEALAQQEISQYQPTTQRSRPAVQRVKETVPTNDVYRGSTTSSTRNPFDVTTQRGTQQQQQPQRGNKFSYYYVQDAIQEVTSPKITKQERPKKKRPQTVQIEQPTYRPATNNPFDQFNQIGNDDFFAKVQANRPTTSTSTSTSSTTSSTTTSTTSAPQSLFTYSTNPQVEFQSTNGQLYHNIGTQSKEPLQEHVPRFTTRPPPIANNDEEEYRMKQYFRQQDAFRNRPHVVNPTNPPFEQVQYTPVPVEYEREVSIPTTTTQKSPSKNKQRVTVYTPVTVPVTTSDVGYNSYPQRDNVDEYNKQLPQNHRPIYNQNEIPDGNVEYEPNPYHVPSELPPLTPDIPGLVNNLQDKQQTTTTPVYETEPPTRPTRRPLLRTRKPVVSKVTSSVSYSESETTSKQNAQRVRRPYSTRGSSSSSANSEDNEDTPTTRRPTSARKPLIRNPNRIRYQPTNEERQSFKVKSKKTHNGSKRNKEDEDLDYQRDVLKQNYPVFKPSRKPTSPTAIPSSYDIGNTEGPTSETQQVYTVTPSNSIDSNNQDFPASLLQPMEIAEHYDEFSKNNYGPGYFPNQEDLSPTEPILRNEVNPVYTTLASTTPSTTTSTTTTTTSTTTEEPIITTTRRSPFIRRNYPRLRTTTTTEPPATTSPPTEERPTRARLPPRRVVKVRARTRRPSHPASSTAAPQEDEVEQVTQKHYTRKYSRFNPDQSENEAPRRRYKQQFKLEGQESQWSPAVKTGNANQENFKPLKDTPSAVTHSYANEPEIVTAGPEEETQKSETYEFNVGANLGSTGSSKTTLKAPNLKPEKSFAELLEEVMGKAPQEIATVAPTDSPRTADYFETQKTTIAARLNRRGKWKKTRIAGTATGQNNESFEAAESQSLGSQIFNSLYSGEKSNPEEVQIPKTTTPYTPPMTQQPPALVVTTTTPQTPTEDYDLSTLKPVDFTTSATTLSMSADDSILQESATRRMDTQSNGSDTAADDLETQPSLFSEVKKQLHDLFEIDESEDKAVTAALAAVGKRRQEYMNIKRTKPIETTTPMTPTSAAALATTGAPVEGDKKDDTFHKDLMDSVVYATSTSTKVTSETEICYRGRCIRSEDLPSNHKLH